MNQPEQTTKNLSGTVTIVIKPETIDMKARAFAHISGRYRFYWNGSSFHIKAWRVEADKLSKRIKKKFKLLGIDAEIDIES